MRMLTLKGFLTQYVKGLSKSNTLNMNMLAAEAEGGNYRLCAPLVLYAVSSGKIDHLLRSLGSSSVADEMRRRLREFSEGPLDQMLASEAIPRDYKKVWDAFHVEKNAPDREKALKEAIRKKVLQQIRAGKCTNYRIYTDLKLNPGNINCWLKYGDSSKVSYRNAERIMNYVMHL